ncbi:MAG: YqgE/AlgH family protein [Bryobacteraceae bacterium]
MASVVPAPLRWFAAALAVAAVLTAQSQKPEDLGMGKLLVAPRRSPDPSFAESVILLLHYDRESALGLMINRRTTVPIARVLRDFNGLARRPDVIYLGGPVERDNAMALVRSAAKPDGATGVTGRVYLLIARQALEKALATPKNSGDLRIYAGYCGWGPGQLDFETRVGGWFIFNRGAELVFDARPDTIWARLIAETETTVAMLH